MQFSPVTSAVGGKTGAVCILLLLSPAHPKPAKNTRSESSKIKGQEKLNEICPAVKTMENDLTSKPSLKSRCPCTNLLATPYPL